MGNVMDSESGLGIYTIINYSRCYIYCLHSMVFLGSVVQVWSSRQTYISTYFYLAFRAFGVHAR